MSLKSFARLYPLLSPPPFCAPWTSRFSTTPRVASSVSAPILTDPVQQLYTATVSFDPLGTDNGKEVEIDAVYQDTLPSGSSIGTVVTLHGSPGSHKDFKYITPSLTHEGIRVIGINYPGFGISQDLPTLVHDNLERNAFVQALIDGIGIRDRIIFMGHSRGSENALKLSGKNIDRTIGTVMLNSPGLRIHRGIRPFADYNRIGLRLNHGRIAMNAVNTMYSTALAKQQPFVDLINDHPSDARLLYCFAGNDFLIETAISREFAGHFKNRQHLVVKSPDANEEKQATVEMREAFLSQKRRTVTVEFVQDGHFLQKHRAQFVTQGIIAMCEAAGKK